MKKENTEDTARMILLYFLEKKRKLLEEKEKIEQEINELAKINQEIKENED